jgi:hypothetical protein
MCFSLELFVEEVIVRSELKTCDMTFELKNQDGYETESDEFDLMR